MHFGETGLCEMSAGIPENALSSEFDWEEVAYSTLVQPIQNVTWNVHVKSEAEMT